MNARRIITLVTDFQSLDPQSQNPFDLAAQIVAEQKELDALIAEAAGQSVVAATIRAAS